MSAESIGVPPRIFQFSSLPEGEEPSICRDAMATVKEFAASHGFEYIRLGLADVRAIVSRCALTVPRMEDMLLQCTNIGQLTDLLRFALLSDRGGWWFDWDVEVVHPDRLLEWISWNGDFSWVSVIDDENDMIATELIGGVRRNSVSRAFLIWAAEQQFERCNDDISWYLRANSLTPDHDFPLGVEMLTRFLRLSQLVRRRLRLVPVSHTFQASYSEVMSGIDRSKSDDRRPLFHHWYHGWSRGPTDLSEWIRKHALPSV